MVDDELQNIRKRLLKINDKIKTYSDLRTQRQATKEKEFKPPEPRRREVPIEDMRAKLRAINDYIRARAAGKNVKPPVFLKDEPALYERADPPELAKPARVASFTESEPVEEVAEVPAEEPVEVQEETSTFELPSNTAEEEVKINYRPGVGLDLGTAYIVASREVDDKRVFVKNERNAFLSVRCDQSTKDLLAKLKVKYVGLGDKLYVLGSMALELADIFGRETQRSMNMGILNPSESESVPIIQLLAQNILWTPRQSGEICCFSIPAQPIDRDQDTIYHRGVFEGILRNIGFEPLVIDEGYAVVLSEMEDQNFTGIGISCGAGMVNICAAFQSVPVLSFSITRGGDWIDKSAATVLGVPTTRVSVIKEHGMNITTPANREEQAIAIYYRNYIHYLIENMVRVFTKATDTPRFKDPVDIVFAGGSSMVGGFIDVVREEIKNAKFGFALGNVLMAKEPFTSVVRGCLFNAINGGVS